MAIKLNACEATMHLDPYTGGFGAYVSVGHDNYCIEPLPLKVIPSCYSVPSLVSSLAFLGAPVSAAALTELIGLGGGGVGSVTRESFTLVIEV
jgi:hypothetical protein